MFFRMTSQKPEILSLSLAQRPMSFAVMLRPLQHAQFGLSANAKSRPRKKNEVSTCVNEFIYCRGHEI